MLHLTGSQCSGLFIEILGLFFNELAIGDVLLAGTQAVSITAVHEGVGEFFELCYR